MKLGGTETKSPYVREIFCAIRDRHFLHICAIRDRPLLHILGDMYITLVLVGRGHECNLPK